MQKLLLTVFSTPEPSKCETCATHDQLTSQEAERCPNVGVELSLRSQQEVLMSEAHPLPCV
jgi:hypothetical protein